MLSKNQIKLINGIKIKKIRTAQGLFMAESTKIVPEILRSDFKVHSLYATRGWLRKNQELFSGLDPDAIFEVSDKELERISGLTTPNEVLMLVEIPVHPFPDLSALSKDLTLVLDEVKDPGNLGTIIRIADWFGIRNIICSENSVDVYNPKVVQATMGSITRVNVFYRNLEEFLSTTSKREKLPVYGALLEGENIYSKKLASNGIIVLGNESAGISNSLLPFIQEKITIPSFGHAESLNISMAAAIICSEFKRYQFEK